MIKAIWLESTDDLTEVFKIRQEVFVNEQNVPPELEFDDTDKESKSLLILDNKKPVATGRLLIQNEKAILGRIAVLKEERGKAYGDFVVRLLIRKAFDLGYEEQNIHAQVNVVKFYEKLGFKCFGDIYEEAGIPHINMKRKGNITGDC